MHIPSQSLEQILSLARKHKVVAIGEIHGVKENPEVVLEVYNALKDKYSVVFGFEYPQTLIDNPDSADQVLYQDGRYSLYHREMLEKLKTDGVKIFGFDLHKEQLEKQKTESIDWRDKIMAENINEQLEMLNPEEKLIVITGDMHYQTKVQSIMYPDSNGEMKPTEYIPVGAQLKADSILAIHLRYLSGQFYNFKLRQMPRIEVNKEISFRELDDTIEIDIQEAHPTK